MYSLRSILQWPGQGLLLMQASRRTTLRLLGEILVSEYIDNNLHGIT